VKQVDGGEEMAASRSRGHRRGPSNWGGSTRRGDAQGGVETVGGGMERAVHGGSVRTERNGGGGAEEQPRAAEVVGGEAPGVGAKLGVVTGSSEGDRGGVSRWLNDGSTTMQWWQRVEEEKGSSRGGALLLKAARGGGRGRRKRWAGRRAGETAKPWVDKAVAAV
jgi:hypothetical protein